MPFNWGVAGRAAAGSLDEILARKLIEKQQADALALRQQQMAQEAEQQAAALALRVREVSRLEAGDQADEAYRAGQVARQGRLDELADTERRQAGNQRGVRRMIGDFLVQRGAQPLDAGARQIVQGMAVQEDVDLPESVTQPPARQVITTIGKRGEPISRAVTEDELVQGVPQYRPPTQGAQSQQANPGMRALAELTARSGQLPEGTPTQRGEILGNMAGDAGLMAQYERTRMEPVRAQAQIMQDALDDLLTKDGQLTPGAQALFGEYTPVFTRGMGIRADTVGANAALRQIVGQRVVDLIRDMKAQSQTGATGFGQLNRAELDIILSAATRLTQRLPEAEAQQELRTLREKLTKILQPSAVEAGTRAGTEPAGGGGGTVQMRTPDGRILNVPADQVAAAEARGATRAQ